jgi:hypothetical protein
MRLLPALALVALAVLPSALAVSGPSALVLRPADVPAGFRLDPDESGLRTNALEAREFPASRKPFRRWQRVTGYQAKYRKGDASIEARADVFRAPTGAEKCLAWVVSELRKSGISGQRLERFRIGDKGWIFWAGRWTLLVWRQGAVFSGVHGDGLSKARVVELARSQQRRIVAAR